MRLFTTLAGLATVGALACSAAQAGPVQVLVDIPTLDRWMYPFGATPGTEIQARSFAALEMPGFDDLDSQFLLGFATGAIVEPNLGVDQYYVTSARIRAWISGTDTFAYDPTYDAYTSALQPSNPAYTVDEDTGRPLEVFAAGYRNGFTALTFGETSPFGGAPVIPPAQGARNVLPVIFDGVTGLPIDVSNHVREGFAAPSLAQGKADLTPGASVPANTEFTFDLDLCVPGARAYLAEGVDQGQVNLLVTSLHAPSGPGGPIIYPLYYTKENPAAQALGYEAKLELTVLVSPFSDMDNSGTLDVSDFIAFQTFFALGDPAADLDGDCVFSVDDFITYQTLFALGK